MCVNSQCAYCLCALCEIFGVVCIILCRQKKFQPQHYPFVCLVLYSIMCSTRIYLVFSEGTRYFGQLRAKADVKLNNNINGK